MSNRIQMVRNFLSLPAHARAVARATSSLVAYFAKRNMKFGSGGKASAGKNPFFFIIVVFSYIYCYSSVEL